MLVNKPWKFCQTSEVVPVLQGNTGCFRSAGTTTEILNAKVFLFFQLFNNHNCRGEIKSPVSSTLLKKQPDAENIVCRDCPLTTYRGGVRVTCKNGCFLMCT